MSAKVLVLAIGEVLPGNVNLLRRDWENCVKNSVAKLRVRQLLSEWVVFGAVIRQLAIRSTAAIAAHPPRAPFTGKMPPREVPNCYFREPESEQWRLAHRSVVVRKSTIPAAEFA